MHYARISTDQRPSLMLQTLDMATAFEKQRVGRISHVSENEQSPVNLLAIADEYLACLAILTF